MQRVADIDSSRRSVNKAAIAAIGRAGVQRAARVHRAGLHVAQQLDGAALRVDGVRLDHAGIVHHGFQEVAGRLGGQQHAAPIGLDQAAIVDQRAHGAPVHRHVQQAVAGHVQRDGIAGRQRHRAQARADRAFVRHIGAQQGHIAARRADRALVQHLARAIAAELVLARHEVAVGNVQGRCHQARRVHGRALAEQHAIRVDDEDLAIRRQIAEYRRAIAAQHAVQRHRIAVGLLELHRFALADIELRPVDDGVLAALVDHGIAGRAIDGRLPRHDRPARRPRQGQAAVAEHQRRRHAGQGEMRSAAAAAGQRALAGGFDVFGNGGVSARGLVPDGAVDAVHGSVLTFINLFFRNTSRLATRSGLPSPARKPPWHCPACARNRPSGRAHSPPSTSRPRRPRSGCGGSLPRSRRRGSA